MLLFSRANPRELENILQIIEKYASWLGQITNRNKSNVLFFTKINAQMKTTLEGITNMTTLEVNFKYFGCKNFQERRTTTDFQFLLDKIAMRI